MACRLTRVVWNALTEIDRDGRFRSFYISTNDGFNGGSWGLTSSSFHTESNVWKVTTDAPSIRPPVCSLRSWHSLRDRAEKIQRAKVFYLFSAYLNFLRLHVDRHYLPKFWLRSRLKAILGLKIVARIIFRPDIESRIWKKSARWSNLTLFINRALFSSARKKHIVRAKD